MAGIENHFACRWCKLDMEMLGVRCRRHCSRQELAHVDELVENMSDDDVRRYRDGLVRFLSEVHGVN